MKIYINNEEVVCSQKMTIKESLKNTSSVILNNVYPKSWETDKDYVSRFYMPKDYSHCLVEGEKEVTTKKIGTFYFSGMQIVNNVITAVANSRLWFWAVVPGVEHELQITATQNVELYGADEFYTNTEVTPIRTIPAGTNTIKITPTTNYIMLNAIDGSGTQLATSSSLTVTNTEKYYNISNNTYTLKNRTLGYANSTIEYSNIYNINYMPVIPGKTYKATIKKTSGGDIYLCEADSLDIGTQATRLVHININGSASFVFKPTCKYVMMHETATFQVVVLPLETGVTFSGVVKNSGNINLNPRYPHYATLQLLDYKVLLSEGDTLNYVLEKQNVTDAIKKVIEGLKGFYVGDLKINDIEMAAYNCNEKTPYDVFEYISEITNSIWYTKAISEDIVTINFYSNDQLPTANTIEYTQEYFTDHNIEDIKYSYSANDYRNKQVIINDETTANILQVENLTYEGESLQTLYPISSISSITSGTKNYSFANERAKSIGQYANFYYNYNSNKIEVNTDIGTGTVLTVSYYPIVSTRQTAYNETEIERIAQTGRNGTIARYEKRTDTNDEKALSQIAQTYLDYKGVPEITLTIKSYYMDILNVGEKVFFNGPLEDLKTNYLVTDKQIEMTTTGDQQVIFYTYKLSSSFNDEGSINFFDNQRRKLEGNIEEGEFIPRYVDIPSSTNIIFYDLTTGEIPIPNDVLDGELDIELVGESTNKLNVKLNFKL